MHGYLSININIARTIITAISEQDGSQTISITFSPQGKDKYWEKIILEQYQKLLVKWYLTRRVACSTKIKQL